MRSLLLCHFIKLVKLPRSKLCKLGHKNPEISSPYFDMFGVVVAFKALCDAVSDLQQACARVLELLLVGQALVWFIQLLQGLLHRPHALLANTEGFLVQFIVLLPFDGNRVGASSDVNWTLGLLPFGSFSLFFSGLGALLFFVPVLLRSSLFFFVLFVVLFLLSLLVRGLLCPIILLKQDRIYYCPSQFRCCCGYLPASQGLMHRFESNSFTDSLLLHHCDAGWNRGAVL